MKTHNYSKFKPENLKTPEKNLKKKRPHRLPFATLRCCMLTHTTSDLLCRVSVEKRPSVG